MLKRVSESAGPIVNTAVNGGEPTGDAIPSPSASAAKRTTLGHVIAWLRRLPTSLSRVTSSTTYVPQIDGLRFLSLFTVMIYHAGMRGERFYPDPSSAEALISHWQPHGSQAVTLCFFISGYIIAYPFLSGRPPALKHFFLRRLTRLEPPYILAMLGCFTLLSIGPAPANAPNYSFTEAPLWHSLMASLTYTHSLVFGQHPRLNPPTWTLEREVQFYLLAPMILYLYSRIRARGPRTCFGAALTL